MQIVHLIFTVILFRFSIIYSARISFAGNFDPFETDLNRPLPSDDEHSSNEIHQQMVNQPSLDLIDDHESDINETISNQSHIIQAGPSLELIDSHPHSHDDDIDNISMIDNAKRALIQPSIDFLDAQLHGGDEHIHDKQNHTNDDEQEPAADLDDFQRWLKEQNQTDQLTRFLSLQKEIKQFHLDDTNELNEKLNRTIELLKLNKQRSKYDL